MPETISEGAKQQLLQQLQNALGLVKDADTSAQEYLKACADQINYAISNIEAIPIDPPPGD